MARCGRHGLAVGPGGQCVLCRREGEARSTAARVSERPASVTADVAAPREEARPLAVAHGSLIRPLLWFVAAALSLLCFVVFRANAEHRAEASAEEALTMAPSGERGEEAERVAAPAAARERVRPRAVGQEGLRQADADQPDDRGAAPPATGAGADPAEAAPPKDPRALLSNVSVTLYTTSWCGYCKKARALLLRNGIAFRERDVERDRDAESSFRSLNPDGGVPTFDIEGDVFTGYSEARIANSLERAIYAKSGQRAEIRFAE